jgi:molybdopterin/thiamine biosynthesis adenylyltransferase
MTEAVFSRQEAFSRNLGLISPSEQDRLGRARVAIAGCGGVGGMHAHTLVRLGVGRFRLTDFDTFSVGNINRQMGATMETVGRDKAEVTAEMIRAINPEAEVEQVPGGVTRDNAAAFVAGADLVVDGVDFFALPARRVLFRAAWEAGIAALTAAPLGFSGTLHVFAPGGMSFDEYFDLNDGQPTFDQFVNFLIGLAPAGLHLPYMDLSKVDPATGRGPSSVVGSQMAACLIGAEAVRVLLGRGGMRLAPCYMQSDVYRRRCATGRLAGGNRNPIQRLKRRVLVRRLRKMGLDEAFAALGR